MSRVEELNKQIADSVSQAVDSYHQKLAEQVRQSTEELQRHLEEVKPEIPSSFLSKEQLSKLAPAARPVPVVASNVDLLGAVRRVDGQGSQQDILNSLVDEAAHFADRVAFFLIRGGQIQTWRSAGFEEGAPKQGAFQASGPIWNELAQAGGALHLDGTRTPEVAGEIGAAVSGDGVMVPFVLRGQVAGALFADRAPGKSPDFASLQVLTHCAAQTLETVSFRNRGGSPALGGISDEVLKAAVRPPAPEAGGDGEGDIWEEDVEDDEPTVVGRKAPDVQPASPSVLDGVGQQTVRLDISQIQGQMPGVQAPAAVEPAPAAQDFELEPEPSNGVEIETEAKAPPAPPPSNEVQPPADMPASQVQPPADMPASQVQPPADMPASQVQPPADMPPASGGGGGTTEVRPPDDLQGPGLAFASQAAAESAAAGDIPAGEEALHEEARRLARLLVSEIKLYNEEVIEEGRMAGNIYSRLKEDIDRSRQMYSERIDPRIKEDYFHQELVQRLAGGDPNLLGL